MTSRKISASADEVVTHLDRTCFRLDSVVQGLDAMTGLSETARMIKGIENTCLGAEAARLTEFARFDQLASSYMSDRDPLGINSIVQHLPHLGALQSIRDSWHALDQAMVGVRSHSFLPEFNKAASALSSLDRLDIGLHKLLPSAAYVEWADHWKSIVGPTAQILGVDWNSRLGVLTSIDSEMGASLTWVNPIKRKKLSTAALVRSDALPKEVIFEIVVTCELCGKTLIASKREFSWTGERKGRLELAVVPICVECTRQSNEDPRYLEQVIRRLEQPKLRLVEGGRTDGVRRGKLRLVRDQDDSPSKEDEM